MDEQIVKNFLAIRRDKIVMQICPIHQVELKQLFTSTYCPLCSSPQEPEVAFEDLPIDQQRVCIAKDVIAQITTKKLRARTGWFITLYCNSNEEHPCSVCALGALVTSYLTTYRKSPDILRGLRGLNHRSRIHNVLRPYFTSDQLDMIESAFEQQVMSLYSDQQNSSNLLNASRQYRDIEDPTERMLKIMQNIIDNHGMFVVTD